MDKTKKEKVDKDIQVIKDKADQIFEKFKSCFAFQVFLEPTFSETKLYFWRGIQHFGKHLKQRSTSLKRGLRV